MYHHYHHHLTIFLQKDKCLFEENGLNLISDKTTANTEIGHGNRHRPQTKYLTRAIMPCDRGCTFGPYHFQPNHNAPQPKLVGNTPPHPPPRFSPRPYNGIAYRVFLGRPWEIDIRKFGASEKTMVLIHLHRSLGRKTYHRAPVQPGRVRPEKSTKSCSGLFCYTVGYSTPVHSSHENQLHR